jgi:hypothetical protein
MTQKPIEVRVGRFGHEQVVYIDPKILLTSKMFTNMITNNNKTLAGVLHLPTFDRVSLGDYIYLLAHGALPVKSSKDKEDEISRMVSIWIKGKQWNEQIAMTIAVHCIIAWIREYKQCIPVKDVENLWLWSEAGSPMTVLIVDVIVKFATEAWMNSVRSKMGNVTFLAAIPKDFIQRRGHNTQESVLTCDIGKYVEKQTAN